ncbi:MAG: hypothetical protein VKJ24_07995 [Synechococcales bacterium]|nr:hypothetical protein [Synechococcales bacterium]
MNITTLKFKSLAARVSLACLALLCLEAMQPKVARAEWLKSLYAGQSAWATYTLNPGNYVLEASTLLNLGDVDIEIYDTTGTRFAKGTKMGSERIFFSVPQGAEGGFSVKYSMPFCINPAGPCPVNIVLSSR